MTKLKPIYKFHIDPIKTKGKQRKIAYTLTIYDHGIKTGYYKYIRRIEYPRYFFRYKQSLIEYNYVKIKEKEISVKGTNQKSKKVVITFFEGSERFADIYRLFLISTLNLRSGRRVDKLARCFANLDPISPVLDTLLSLEKMITLRRFVQVLRGYCLCLK